MSHRRAFADVMRIRLVARYALPAILMGFAHHPALAETQPDTAAQALPDGTIPVICFGTGEDPNKSIPCRISLCDACILMAGAHLPSACATVTAVDFGDGVMLTPVDQLARPARLFARDAARGPPSPTSCVRADAALTDDPCHAAS